MIGKAIASKQPRTTTVLVSMTILFFVAVAIALSRGQVVIPLREIFQVLGSKLGMASEVSNSISETVLWNIRLPRVIMTVAIGASLAVSGASLQGLFRNPLVEPGLIGVSSGSALFVVLLIVFGPHVALDTETSQMYFAMPFVAFAGGLLATLLVVRISSSFGLTNIAMLILAGVAVNALAGAFMGLAIFYADENQLRMFTFWTLGDLSGATWQRLAIAVPLLAFATVRLLSFKNALNAIALGESEAFHMGVDVEKVKRSIVFYSALAVGVSVSLAGIIGFVGLVIPHLIRVLFQTDNRLVLPASIIGGPLLLILADLAARTMAAPSELPIGVVTALVGAPFFIYLLVRANSKRGIA